MIRAGSSPAFGTIFQEPRGIPGLLKFESSTVSCDADAESETDARADSEFRIPNSLIHQRRTYPFACILAQVSRRVTVRLKTGRSGGRVGVDAEVAETLELDRSPTANAGEARLEPRVRR